MNSEQKNADGIVDSMVDRRKSEISQHNRRRKEIFQHNDSEYRRTRKVRKDQLEFENHLGNVSGGEERQHRNGMGEQSEFLDRTIGEEIINEESSLTQTHRRRCIRPEDILWWICLFLTFRCFDLPAMLIFNRRIERRYLKLALLCPFILLLFIVVFSLAKMIFGDRVNNILRMFQTLSISIVFAAAVFFCLSTWKVLGIWSLFTAVVISMSFLAAISVI